MFACSVEGCQGTDVDGAGACVSWGLMLTFFFFFFFSGGGKKIGNINFWLN